MTRPPEAVSRNPRFRDARGLDVLEAKLKTPVVRPGTVARPRLVKALRSSDARVTAIVAPAGYGKTTLLAEWAAAETRPVAWVAVDDRDNDPVRLVRHIVVAVDRIEPVDRRLFTLLQAPSRSSWPATADRAVRTAAACIRPYVLMLDNVDLLRSREARRVVASLIGHVPQGSTLVLAARVMPKLRVAGLREHGALQEVGIRDLALTPREGQLLLRAAEVDLSDEETEELVERSEGWPAALYLAALSLREGTPASMRPAHFTGDDRYLVDYLRTEYVSHLRRRELRFLCRTSILRALTGPLCDAVLQDQGSAHELQKIARANLFLMPLERPGWYRFHQLFRDLLLGELAKAEPQLIPTLHRRAADWFVTKGDLETALEHADAAGDSGRVAALIGAIAFPVSSRGRAATLAQWLGRFDASALERYPLLAVHGSRLHALRGQAADAEQWFEAAQRTLGSRRRDVAGLRPKLAVVSAALCRGGPRQMLLDANAALLKLRRGSEWRPDALLMRGTAAMLLGAPEEAEAVLAAAAVEAAALGWTETHMIAIAQQALIAGALGDVARTDELAHEARAIGVEGKLTGYPTFALALASCAHSSLRRGRWAETRELLAAAEPSRASLTEALPWLAVGARLELARCYVTLRELDQARALLAEITAILELRPDLGVLVDLTRELARDVRTLALVEENARLGLTPAELRLLPLLATHLSFREIADQLQVSRNTVKTQAISIYRKLGVSGRSDAIAEAARLDPTGAAA